MRPCKTEKRRGRACARVRSAALPFESSDFARQRSICKICTCKDPAHTRAIRHLSKISWFGVGSINHVHALSIVSCAFMYTYFMYRRLHNYLSSRGQAGSSSTPYWTRSLRRPSKPLRSSNGLRRYVRSSCRKMAVLSSPRNSLTRRCAPAD